MGNCFGKKQQLNKSLKDMPTTKFKLEENALKAIKGCSQVRECRSSCGGHLTTPTI